MKNAQYAWLNIETHLDKQSVRHGKGQQQPPSLVPPTCDERHQHDEVTYIFSVIRVYCKFYGPMMYGQDLLVVWHTMLVHTQ